MVRQMLASGGQPLSGQKLRPAFGNKGGPDAVNIIRYLRRNTSDTRTEQEVCMLRCKRVKQASLAVLAAACLLLSGCGKGNGSISLAESDTAADMPGGAFTAEELVSESEVGTIFAAAPAEGGLYAFGSELMLLGFDGSVETIPGISSVVKMCAGDGGTAWVLHRLPTDADSAPVYELGRLSGAEYSPTCSPDIGQKEVTVGMCAAGDMVYIALTDYLNSHRIAVYSASSGEKQRDISVSGPIDLASDGETVYAGSAETTGGGALSVFRLEDGEEIARFDGGSLLSASGGRLCISDGTSAFEYDIASGELTRLFGFISCGLSGRQVTVWPDGDGGYVAVGREGAALVRCDENARTKTQLVLAVNGQSYFISSSILEFNASGGEYELAVKDYSGYSDPLTVLNTELIAGNGPDIIDVNSFSSTILNPDAMVDLLPLIEADPQLGPDSLIDGALNAMLTDDGRLPAIAPVYYVSTLVSRDADAAPFTSVSDALGRMGSADEALGGTMARDMFLTMAFGCGGAEAYDAADIQAILEYAQALPEEEDHSSEMANLASGTQRYSFQTIGGAGGLFGAAEDFGCSLEDLKVCGLPFREGSGTLVPVVYLAIPASSKNVGGAFDFIKSLMLEENTLYKNLELNAFPILSAEYERLAEYEQPRIDAAEEGQYPWTDTSHYERAAEVLDGLNGLCCPDTALMGIVDDAAAGYFAGAVDAAKAADELASRLGIYFAERGR